ncbi:MAG: hypothetical protein PVG07_13400 [Acidobacteriota bacterium]|jgi:hypothetical protein
MPYQYILANLLAKAEGSVGVLFLDDSGETVDLACSDYTPYQMRVLGAYLGIYMRQLRKVTEGNSLGTLELIHIEKESLHVYAAPLPDGYYLVLVQPQPALAAKAEKALYEAAEELARHLFAA